MYNVRVLVSLFIVILINAERLFLTEVLCDAIQLVRHVINYHFGVLFFYSRISGQFVGTLSLVCRSIYRLCDCVVGHYRSTFGVHVSFVFLHRRKFICLNYMQDVFVVTFGNSVHVWAFIYML